MYEVTDDSLTSTCHTTLPNRFKELTPSEKREC